MNDVIDRLQLEPMADQVEPVAATEPEPYAAEPADLSLIEAGVPAETEDAPQASGRLSNFLAKAAVCATAALAAAGTLASTAEARPAQLRIIPGRSIGGVKLGERAKDVKRELGKPNYVNHVGKTVVWFFSQQPFRGPVALKHGKVDTMGTYSKRQRTNRGIGPGSSYAATTRKYPGAKCDSSPIGPNAEVCVIEGKIGHRKTNTSFIFADTSKPMQEVDMGIGRQ